MNSFDLNAVTIRFAYPWLLFLLIPAVALMLWPYFRLPKKVRRTRNRVISLALHSVILVLCVLMVSGLSLHFSQVDVKHDVILLVDLSDSNKSSEEDMNSFIRSVLDAREPDYRVGVITFANGSVYASQMRADSNGVYNDYLHEDEIPLGNATNIADALMFARDALSDPSGGRIILLSDGVQTDGNALAAVKSLANEGTRVDTVFFSLGRQGNEVLISSVDVPQRASLGETLSIRVNTRSTSPCSATIKLYDGGEYFAEQEVDLSGAEDTFTFEYPLLLPGLHEFSVTIDSAEDVIEENNRFYSYINIETYTNILVVDGSGNESGRLTGLLEETYDVTTMLPAQLPDTAEELAKYDEVIFMNVANADLPAGFDDILTQYVEDYGGGFYTIGGDKAYEQGDMQGSKYESLLPIEANTEAKSLGLLIIIDCSSSMRANAVGTNTPRIDLAKDAAIASLEALDSDDYVGVMGFNSDHTTIQMRPISQKELVARDIRNLTTAIGTYYEKAISYARTTFQSFSATDLKHVIFLADGNGNDISNADSLARVKDHISQMARHDITVSTIALGPDVSTKNLQDFATLGGGEFYNAARESELKDIMVQETTRVAGNYYNEEVFTPSILNRTSAVAGITALPELGGYFGATAKDGAIVVLGYDSDPIYAEWQKGKGRVGSFMSDLNGTWSSSFFEEDSSGRQFILNTVAGLFSKVPSDAYSPVRAEFSQENFSTRVSIVTDRAGEVTAELVAPDNSSVSLSLEQLSERTFTALFDTDQAGVYTLRIRSGGEEYTAYTAFSYSAEYNVFTDESASFAFMESLSEEGNGAILFSPENLFGKRNEKMEADYSPMLALLIIAAVLFLLDIVVRKFKIKWPSEIREERRKRREEAPQ